MLQLHDSGEARALTMSAAEDGGFVAARPEALVFR